MDGMDNVSGAEGDAYTRFEGCIPLQCDETSRF
jgi:hypothetical protein